MGVGELGADRLEHPPRCLAEPFGVHRPAGPGAVAGGHRDQRLLGLAELVGGGPGRGAVGGVDDHPDLAGAQPASGERLAGRGVLLLQRLRDPESSGEDLARVAGEPGQPGVGAGVGGLVGDTAGVGLGGQRHPQRDDLGLQRREVGDRLGQLRGRDGCGRHPGRGADPLSGGTHRPGEDRGAELRDRHVPILSNMCSRVQCLWTVSGPTNFGYSAGYLTSTTRARWSDTTIRRASDAADTHRAVGEHVVDLPAWLVPGEGRVRGERRQTRRAAGSPWAHVEVTRQHQRAGERPQASGQDVELLTVPPGQEREVGVDHRQRPRRGLDVGGQGHSRLVAHDRRMPRAGPPHRRRAVKGRQSQSPPPADRHAAQQRDAVRRRVRWGSRRSRDPPVRRTRERRQEPVRDRAHRLRGDRRQVAVPGSRLVAVDLLEREHVDVELRDRTSERSEVRDAVLRTAAAEDVEGRETHSPMCTRPRSRGTVRRGAMMEPARTAGPRTQEGT